jgi:RNA polymerase sigma-70 factor, ECF subfamily
MSTDEQHNEHAPNDTGAPDARVAHVAHAADLALARRAVARDEAAWGEIFATARDLTYGAAWRYGLDAARDDLLQDAMERLLRQMGTYRGESPLRVWIASVCYNRLRNAYRAQRVRDRFSAPSPAPGAEPASTASADAAALRASEHALTSAAMAGLSEPHWNVVLLRVVAELTVEETARRLAVREGTVKSRLSRALAELRLYVLVLRGTPLAAASRVSGLTVQRARERLAAALPVWRGLLPAAVTSALEWRVAREDAYGEGAWGERA